MARLLLGAVAVLSVSLSLVGCDEEGGGAPSVWRPDAGALGADAGVSWLPADPFAGPDTCTTGSRWTGGDHESPYMHPGGTCISCHTSRHEGPRFALAGTVFPSGHEVDDCNGIGSLPSDPIVVEVTDAAGQRFTMTPNAAGNFYEERASVTFPITAVVRYQGRERRMSTPVPSGDCNSCHTVRGATAAPGRIVVP